MKQVIKAALFAADMKTLKRIAKDQGITRDVYWGDVKQAREEVWDMVFKRLPEEDAQEMVVSYGVMK